MSTARAEVMDRYTRRVRARFYRACEDPPIAHSIIIRGARENNLKDVSLAIPKLRITVFTGVSGSGKSSIVFDTIAAESQRLLNDTMPAFVQTFRPNYGQPDADELAELSPAIIVDQKIGGNSRSTVGTYTDAYTMLRVLFSRIGEPSAGLSSAYSFNDPRGMCPECDGLGRIAAVDEDALVNPDLSLNETVNAKYEGLVLKLKKSVLGKELDTLQGHMRAAVERIATQKVCAACDGSRLNDAARASRIDGTGIAECSAMETRELAAWVRAIAAEEVAPVTNALAKRLEHLDRIGLGYLSLDRPTATLSGGESQRVKLVRHLGSALTGMTYSFDEPSIGLHPHDVHRLNELLVEIRDKGDTVLVVEHEPDVIAVADHVVDMGPGAGRAGGSIVYEGDVEGLLASGTITGDHFASHQPLKTDTRRASGAIAIRGATRHTLKDLSVDIPRGVLTVVTGVAGSGKSSLIHGYVRGAEPDAILIDQRLGSGSRRSNHATYTGILDPIIDRGPGAGHDGGTIVFEGPPHELVGHPASLTGEHLARRHLARAG